MTGCKDCYKNDVCKYYLDSLISHHKENVIINCSNYKNTKQIIELPCKVGDILYFVDRGRIEKFVVEDVNYSVKQNKNTIRLSNISNVFDVFTTSFEHFIGYKLFFTLEEAEKVLKENLNEK